MQWGPVFGAVAVIMTAFTTILGLLGLTAPGWILAPGWTARRSSCLSLTSPSGGCSFRAHRPVWGRCGVPRGKQAPGVSTLIRSLDTKTVQGVGCGNDAGFPFGPTFLLSSRTSRRQRQDP